MELPKRFFSYKTLISSSLKAAEALGLLPLLKRLPSLLELDVFHKAKSIVFFLQMALKASEECPQGTGLVFLVVLLFANRYKELAEKLVQLLRSQFMHLSRLAFQNKKFVEQSSIVFGLFLGVVIVLSMYELFY